MLIPFLAVRFLLLFYINRDALQRAAHFAPAEGNEKAAYYIYQISNIVLFLYLFCLTVKLKLSWQLCFGIVFYFAGLCLCAVSVVNFAFPDDTGLNTNGVYRLSRNPMYVAYFICFIGMALLTRSLILFCIVLIFQISAHWIILSEERECTVKFGEPYIEYMKNVKRYI